MSEFSMDRVVALLHERGVEAMVEETGGGVATILAGPTWVHHTSGDRYACVAGVGHYAPGNSVAFTEDFCWGPDDVLVGDAWATATTTEADIADGIARCVRVSVAGHLRAAAELGVDVGTVLADTDLPADELADAVAMAEHLVDGSGDSWMDSFRGWDVRPYAQRDGEPTEVDVVLYGEFSHDVPVFEGSAHTAWDFLHPGRYEVRVAGLPLFAVLQVTDDWSGIVKVAA